MSPKELRSRRIALGLTTGQLAQELGLTAPELQQMERGQLPLPPHAQLVTALSELEQRRHSVDCLIVEDDDAIRHLFATRLRAEGCTVDEAADGMAAIDATATRDYRLMLLDLRLPKLSGVEVLARLMKKPGPRSNVIVISAAGSGDVREVANSKEVNAILRKSFAIAHADVIFPALAALARV
ncbi:MAG TPA: response regulator [Thermoanaerobaculia bacterium]|jgi:CheY-like chemotaxis protein/DNA-binding XRE family transcriptional regulator